MKIALFGKNVGDPYPCIFTARTEPYVGTLVRISEWVEVDFIPRENIASEQLAKLQKRREDLARCYKEDIKSLDEQELALMGGT